MTLSAFSARAALVWGMVLLSGCTDSFTPEIVKTPPNYLVVDGFINAQGVSTIKLSRTYAISSTKTPPVEARATAYIEEESGPRYALREAPTGTYTSAALNLNPGKKYRLHLNTVGGQEYASDYVPAKITPPIDAITWKQDQSDFNIYVSAHDATNNTVYYRWDYDEGWEIRPAYDTNLEWVNHAVVFRAVRFPSVCYGSDIAHTVQIDKTSSQTQDVVAEHLVRKLPANSERLYTRYSIRVQQFALTKEEYAYWDLLKKNTQSIGTLYDPQPAQLTGNVRCLSNPGDVALGFVGAHSVSEKRIFLTPADLPSTMHPLSGYESCIPPDFIDLYPPGVDETPQQIMERSFGYFLYIPVNAIYKGATVVAYDAATPDCLDCRLRAPATKPSYWP